MHIGILQCGHTPADVARVHGDYDAMFRRLFGDSPFYFTTWNVVDMEFPEGIDAVDGWLITGSKHGVYEDHAFIPPLIDLIRKIDAAHMPMIGICFGHQAIAKALGGHVEKFKGGWAIGNTTYEFEGLGPVHLNAWHQDQVITPPEGARTIATHPFCAHAALRYGNDILTIQAHPEFSRPVFRDYLTLRRDSPDYPAEMMQQAIADIDLPLDGDRLADIMANHLLHERTHA